MLEKTRLKKSWVWNNEIEGFVRSRVKGYTLNVCAGKSSIGDVKIDLDPQNKSVLKGDMRDLPFPEDSFDTVLQDPPWKIGYFQRMAPFFECVRVCKLGGRIIYNAYWIPASKCVKLREAVIRQDSPWSNTSIISVFEKTKDVSGEEKKYREGS